MILKTLQVGEEVLRQKAKKVDRKLLAKAETQSLIDSMLSTLRDAPGVGLAAPQVGELLQIIVIEDKAEYHDQVPEELLNEQERKPIQETVLINPEITYVGKDNKLYFEGCLSIDGYVAAVSRCSKVKVEALDRNGSQVSFVASGWFARIIQHEVDHLEGIINIDRMKSESFMSVKNFTKYWRKALQDEIKRTYSSY